MVIVAQLVRASDCGSEGCGFKSHRSPKKNRLLFNQQHAHLAQLAEQRTLNPEVTGSIPVVRTTLFLYALAEPSAGTP